MKNIKWIMVFIIIVLITLITILITINKESNVSEIYEDSGPQDTFVPFETEVDKETNDHRFFGINDYINKFLKYVNDKDEEASYAMLDNDYKKENNIQKTSEIIITTYNIEKYYAQEMYKRESKDNFEHYVYGVINIINNTNTSRLSDMYFKVFTDKNSKSASIVILSKEEYEKNINDKSNNVEKKTIAKNQYNSYDVPVFTSWDLSRKYIEDYTMKLKYNKNLAFNLLDSEYKNKKFKDNMQEFEQYIEANKENLYNIKIHDCENKVEAGYIEYTITDANNHTYVIKRNNAMDYAIILN